MAREHVTSVAVIIDNAVKSMQAKPTSCAGYERILTQVGGSKLLDSSDMHVLISQLDSIHVTHDNSAKHQVL